MSFPNQEGFLFFPMILKKGKGQPGSFRKDVLPADTSPARFRALSAHLRPVLACPRGASRVIRRIAVLSRHPMGREPRCPGALPCPAPAPCLQVQTTKKAQVSNALKTSTSGMKWGLEQSWLRAWAWWSTCSLHKCGRPPSECL